MFSSIFHATYLDYYIPEEVGRAQRPKRCINNNNDDDNSPHVNSEKMIIPHSRNSARNEQILIELPGISAGVFAIRLQSFNRIGV